MAREEHAGHDHATQDESDPTTGHNGQSSSPSGRGNHSRPPQPLTVEVLLQSTTMQRYRHETTEQYLGRLSHLQLQGRRLGPSLTRLDLVQNTNVMYAYDNLITSLSGFEPMKRLQQLYLQNNRLASLAGIEVLTNLRKLYLDHNRLAKIEGLSCSNLEELHVPHQRPSEPHTTLEFDPASIAVIASSLRVLNAASNELETVAALAPLQGLNSLDLSNNQLREFPELRDLLASEELKKLTLAGNPLAANERRYRTSVILIAKGVEVLDGKELLPQERSFVKLLEEQKRKLEVQRQRHLQRGDAGPSSGIPVSTAKVENLLAKIKPMRRLSPSASTEELMVK